MLASRTNHFLRFVHDRKSAPRDVRIRHCRAAVLAKLMWKIAPLMGSVPTLASPFPINDRNEELAPNW